MTPIYDELVAKYAERRGAPALFAPLPRSHRLRTRVPGRALADVAQAHPALAAQKLPAEPPAPDSQLLETLEPRDWFTPGNIRLGVDLAADSSSDDIMVFEATSKDEARTLTRVADRVSEYDIGYALAVSGGYISHRVNPEYSAVVMTGTVS